MKLKSCSQKIATAIGGALFLSLFFVFVYQVGARFIFGKPIEWTDEAAVILYIWVIIWTAAFILPTREHVVFDLIWNWVSPQSRRMMQIIGNLMMGGLALVAIPASLDYVHFMNRESTPVLDIPFMWVFMPFVLLWVALVLRSAWAIWQAIQGVSIHVNKSP